MRRQRRRKIEQRIAELREQGNDLLEDSIDIMAFNDSGPSEALVLRGHRLLELADRFELKLVTWHLRFIERLLVVAKADSLREWALSTHAKATEQLNSKHLQEAFQLLMARPPRVSAH